MASGAADFEEERRPLLIGFANSFLLDECYHMTEIVYAVKDKCNSKCKCGSVLK